MLLFSLCFVFFNFFISSIIYVFSSIFLFLQLSVFFFQLVMIFLQLFSRKLFSIVFLQYIFCSLVTVDADLYFMCNMDDLYSFHAFLFYLHVFFFNLLISSIIYVFSSIFLFLQLFIFFFLFFISSIIIEEIKILKKKT